MTLPSRRSPYGHGRGNPTRTAKRRGRRMTSWRWLRCTFSITRWGDNGCMRCYGHKIASWRSPHAPWAECSSASRSAARCVAGDMAGMPGGITQACRPLGRTVPSPHHRPLHTPMGRCSRSLSRGWIGSSAPGTRRPPRHAASFASSTPPRPRLWPHAARPRRRHGTPKSLRPCARNSEVCPASR